MQFIPILAVAEKFSTSVLDALPHLAGMLMVMTTLTILWGICALTAKLVHVMMPEQTAAAAIPAAKTAVTPRPAVTAGMPAELVAVVAAAVATVTGNQPVRIVSIKPMSTSWEKAGRQSVLTSHRIR